MQWISINAVDFPNIYKLDCHLSGIDSAIQLLNNERADDCFC